MAEQATDQSLSDAAEYLFTEPANCSIKVNKDGETVYLEGQVKTQFSTQCSRCAEEAISSVSSPVKLQFKPKSYGAALGEEDEDLEISYYEGTDIDLSDPLVDMVMLQLPFSVLCSESCQGLCSKCGINLNNAKCDCEVDEKPEGPFAMLKSVKIQ